MKSNESFLKVKNKFELKKKECSGVSDEITLERIKFIEAILHNERCFFEMKKSIAIEILSFLGFSDDEAFELYEQLTDYEAFKGKFNFIPEGQAKEK